VITMELIAEIRRRHFVGGESISALSRSVGLSRPTVRKHLLTTIPPVYSWAGNPGRRLGCFEESRQSCKAVTTDRCCYSRRAGLLAVPRSRWCATAPSHQPTLRKNIVLGHNKPLVCRIGHRIWRCQDDNRSTRLDYPSLCNHRNRKWFIPFQTTQITN